MRCTMTRVLPEPGPATISSGPSDVRHRLPLRGFRPSRMRSPRSAVDATTPESINEPASRSLQRVGSSPRSLLHVDSNWKALTQVLEVGDDQDLFELLLTGLDGVHHAVAALLVL